MEGVIGYTTLFAGNFAPKNWAFCQGQLIPIQQNTALFSILGTNYGGNGTTNFALPDLRGRSVIGAGSAPGLSSYTIGEIGGVEGTALAYNEMGAHVHPVQVTITPNSANNTTVPDPAGNVYGQGTEQMFNPTADSQMQGYPGALTMANSGGGVPYPSLRPVLALNYVVCLYGVFPARN